MNDEDFLMKSKQLLRAGHRWRKEHKTKPNLLDQKSSRFAEPDQTYENNFTKTNLKAKLFDQRYRSKPNQTYQTEFTQTTKVIKSMVPNESKPN